MTRFFHIPFQMSVPANSTMNQASSPLSSIKMIVGARLNFPSGTGGKLQYRFFECPSQPTTNTSLPNGPDITSHYVPTGIYVGDGLSYPVEWQKAPAQDGECIVMYAINNSSIVQVASAQVEIMI